MHKIYSRPRIRLLQPNGTGEKKIKYIRKTARVFIILVIAITVASIIMKAVSPVFEKLCRDEARSIATLITNEQATKVMADYSYQDLFSVEKDEEGNISMIKSNIFPINEIISNIAIQIQNELNNEGRNNIPIALGTFTGVKLLAGWGPNVNIKVSSTGNIETDLKSEFTAQGINQTLHRVYLQVNCQISILTPFANTEETITNQVLIAENVIVGRIPSTYYNLNGLDTSQGVDLVQ